MLQELICGCRITVYYTRLPSQGRGFDSHQPLALVMEFGNEGFSQGSPH